MEQILPAVLAVFLIASWVYILLLRVRLRDCLTYIVNRMEMGRKGLEGVDSRIRDEGGVQKAVSPSGVRVSGVMSTEPERSVVPEPPQLILSSSGKDHLVHHRCSRCSQVFPLSGDHSPREAVARLYLLFLEHVDREHPYPSPGPRSESRA